MPSPIENILFLTKSLTDHIWMLLNYNYVHQEINLKVESPISTHINIQGEKIEKQIKKCFEKVYPVFTTHGTGRVSAVY